jgi:hypothetical protein
MQVRAGARAKIFIDANVEFLIFRLGKEGCNHVPDFDLLRHSLPMALGNSVRRSAAALRHCPYQKDVKEVVNT